MIGQTDGYFGRCSVCEIKHPSLNVHRFVVHAIGFKAGDNRLTTHHGEPAVCVVEHHVSTVEITSNQDTGRSVRNSGLSQVRLTANLHDNTRPQSLAVRALCFGHDARIERGLLGHQCTLDDDGVVSSVDGGAR